MNLRTQLVCAWLGPIGTVILFFAMFFLMGILPPFRPSLAQGELVAIYRQHPIGMLTGGLLLMLATSIYMAFFALVAVQMKRMEKTPFWTYVFLTSSILAFYSVIVAEMVFSAAAYRPERSDMLIQALSDLAFRSKALWGYSDEFMEGCREELALTPDEIREHPTYVLERDGTVLGFYALEPLASAGEAIELGHLFVAPTAVRRGVGRALLEHAIAEARRRGYRTLVIQSDPNAVPFYESLGARVVGTKDSASIPGRRLPLLERSLGP